MYRGRNADVVASDASRRLTDLTRAVLALGADDVVSISEIACGEPACGGAETVVLVMRAGRRSATATIKTPMAQVTDDALREALAGLGQ